MTLKELVEESEYIFIGQVTNIQRILNVRVATFNISESIKGPKKEKIYFLAEKTWACDISSAKNNEKLLLFLHEYDFNPNPQALELDTISVRFGFFNEPVEFKAKIMDLTNDFPFLQIMFAGRGRMTLSNLQEDEYASLYVENVILPDNVKTTDVIWKDYSDFYRSVRLDTLVGLIKSYLRAESIN